MAIAFPAGSSSGQVISQIRGTLSQKNVNISKSARQ
ncbi:hypothetical protein SPLC1_S412240 [Arthrospira platensis C1]|nr:hypothetical protein SPLC1_S412240 [Arthrospira platensis C1]